jgi:hypothetical protein
MVGIATGYGLESWGSFPGKGRDFSLLHSVQTGCGPTSLVSTEYRGLRVKRLGVEPDHSLPSGAEAKYGGVIPPFPHMSS